MLSWKFLRPITLVRAPIFLVMNVLKDSFNPDDLRLLWLSVKHVHQHKNCHILTRTNTYRYTILELFIRQDT